MRKQIDVITCDRCGKIIKGTPVNIATETAKDISTGIAFQGEIDKAGLKYGERTRNIIRALNFNDLHPRCARKVLKAIDEIFMIKKDDHDTDD